MSKKTSPTTGRMTSRDDQWLPNTIVTGTVHGEASPVKRLRASGDGWARRLFVHLYDAHNLRDVGGISPWLLRYNYERKKVGEHGSYTIWAFKAGLFEIAPTLGISFLPSPEKLVRSMQRLIVATLDEQMEYPNSGWERRPPILYFRLATLVEHMHKTASVITFNYDIGLDYAMVVDSGRIDYALDEDGQTNGGVPLLKLHGSTNWRRCPECKTVRIGGFRSPNTSHLGQEANLQYFHLRSQDLDWKDCCAKPLEPDPVIVPPVWNKGQYHNSIGSVWRRAAKELSEARNIIVVGYSLPETDLFFRYLYALGTVGENLLERFWVLDLAEAVKERFQRLLGPGALSRFRFHQGSFDELLPWLREAFPNQVDAANGKMMGVRRR